MREPRKRDHLAVELPRRALVEELGTLKHEREVLRQQVAELAAALERALKALDRVRPQTTGVLVIEDVDGAVAGGRATLERVRAEGGEE